MIVLTSAVVLPMVQKAGFDLIWFGIFLVLLIEIAEVTPPVGFNLFVLQNMTGKDSHTIARAALPFFALLVACIAIITVFPQVVTWLPNAVMGADGLSWPARCWSVVSTTPRRSARVGTQRLRVGQGASRSMVRGPVGGEPGVAP